MEVNFMISKLYTGVSFKCHEYIVVIGGKSGHNCIYITDMDTANTIYSFPIKDFYPCTVDRYILFHKRLIEKLHKDSKLKNRCLIQYFHKLESAIMKFSCTGYLIGDHKNTQIEVSSIKILSTIVGRDDICFDTNSDILAIRFLSLVNNIIAIKIYGEQKYTFIYLQSKSQLKTWIEHIVESRSGKPNYLNTTIEKAEII